MSVTLHLCVHALRPVPRCVDVRRILRIRRTSDPLGASAGRYPDDDRGRTRADRSDRRRDLLRFPVRDGGVTRGDGSRETGDGTSVRAADEDCVTHSTGVSAALVRLALAAPIVPCALEAHAIGTRAVYLYARTTFHPDLDLLRACSSTSADLPTRPWVRIRPSGSGYPRAAVGRISPPDRVVLALGPDAIQAAVESGNTIAYSALTPPMSASLRAVLRPVPAHRASP